MWSASKRNVKENNSAFAHFSFSIDLDIQNSPGFCSPSSDQHQRNLTVPQKWYLTKGSLFPCRLPVINLIGSGLHWSWKKSSELKNQLYWIMRLPALQNFIVLKGFFWKCLWLRKYKEINWRDSFLFWIQVQVGQEFFVEISKKWTLDQLIRNQSSSGTFRMIIFIDSFRGFRAFLWKTMIRALWEKF